MSSINLKPNKPEAFDGNREFLIVNTRLYSVEKYLNLSKLSSPTTPLMDHDKKKFASSYLKQNAAVWWYNLVNSPSVPITWEDFKAAVVRESVPVDHTRRARDKLRNLKQTSSAEKYLSEYRNTVLMIGKINEGEKVDRFVDGLKYQAKVEVMKIDCEFFEDCARVALYIDSAIWRAKRGPAGFYPISEKQQQPTPMEIGNVYGGPDSRAHREQQKKDLNNGACFRCHKRGCRPWRCNPSKLNNISIHDETIIGSAAESGNSEK